MHWGKVTEQTRGFWWMDFVEAIAKLPSRQIWRHNQAGDLPGKSGTINASELNALVDANRGKRGFTYTHKPLTPRNVRLIQNANANGFTINASTESLEQAAYVRRTHSLPVVITVPEDAPVKLRLSNGENSILCPAQARKGVQCWNKDPSKSCGRGNPLCQRVDRSVAIHFRAHGAGRKLLQAA